MPKVMQQGKLVDMPDFGTDDEQGHFIRWESPFRDWVTADGSTGYRAEPGRYHLYVSYACPWAHRTLIARKLKKLEDIISVSVVHPLMGPESWHFGECGGCTPDHLFGAEFLYQVYCRAKPDFTGVVTVPALFDRETNSLVNNESSEIMRMFNSAFDQWADSSVDLCPEPLREEIDALNADIYDNINNGVYKAGFARTQGAYEEGFDALFEALDRLEARLAGRRFLTGPSITEADWRLFATLVRFDAVYFTHFKCNLRRLTEYPHLWGYTRDLYQQPGIAETVRIDHIKRHYFGSHPQLNPKGIIPKGPALDFLRPHERDRL